jgi:hypothetical protein
VDKFPLGWDYYSLLSQSFQKGQTSLLVEPSPELMKLENPYDHAQLNTVQYIWDAVYFKGKYYLYWGPVPAALGLIISFVTSSPVPDSELVFIFVAGIAFFSILLLRDICRDWQFPSWVLAGGVLASAVNIPLIWLLNRPAVYEAAISGGQFFMMAGFFALYRAFRASFPHKVYLLLASIAFGLAWTSRLNLFPSVVFLACVLLLRIYITYQNKLKASILSFVVVVFPLVLVGGLMAWYNYVRFGSVFEFGHKYQLTAAADYKEIYSFKYIIPNAYTYIFRIPLLDSSFPFITIPALNLKNAFPAFIRIPEHYPHPAPVAGLLIIFPVVGLAVLLAIRWLWLFINGDLVYAGDKSFTEHSLLNWFSFSVFGCGAIQMTLLLIFQYSSVRYMVDFTPAFVLLAVIFMGFYARSVERKPSYLKLISWLWIIASLLTVLAGFFINFTAEENIFITKNPQLYAQFVEWFRFH